jgi:hypothetical protein
MPTFAFQREAKNRRKKMSKIKNAMMEKQNDGQAVKEARKRNEPTIAAVAPENPWLEAAAEAGNPFGKLLKYVKGAWQLGDDEVPIGTKYIAYIDQLARGWIHFEDGAVVGDPIIIKIADGSKLPPREALGENDPTKWKEKDADGRPRDPWVCQWYLPLVAVSSGELNTFVTGSDGGNQAIANLCSVYGRKLHEGALPIVALQSTTYKHKKYGRIEKPELVIVGWHPILSTPAARHQVSATATVDMDDEIPF